MRVVIVHDGGCLGWLLGLTAFVAGCLLSMPSFPSLCFCIVTFCVALDFYSFEVNLISFLTPHLSLFSLPPLLSPPS